MPYADLEKRRAYSKKWRQDNQVGIAVANKKWWAENRERGLRQQKKWREENLDRVADRNKKWRKENPDKIRALNKQWRLDNPEKRRQQALRRWRVRKNDPRFRLCYCLRLRLYSAMRGKAKSAKTFELLGCSIEFLRERLEKQFRPGMTWENYGPIWHVDHIKPCAKFDLADSEQQKICFHYTNLQPLFVQENLSKGDKF